MNVVSKPAPPPKKALSALLPRKTAPVRKKPPPPRSSSYEQSRAPPPPKKRTPPPKLNDIPKPNSISALLPPPPERKSRATERNRTDTVQPPAALPETKTAPPTRPRNKLRQNLIDTTRGRHSTTALPPDLAGISRPPSTKSLKGYNSAPPILNTSKATPSAVDLEREMAALTRERGDKPTRASTVIPDVSAVGAPPLMPTSFNNSPVPTKQINSSSSNEDLFNKLMNFTASNEFDIYAEDPSAGLPGSSSQLIEEEEVQAAISERSISREQSEHSYHSSGELPAQLRENFRSYSPPPEMKIKKQSGDDELHRASTAPAPTSPGNNEDALPMTYIPRSASMDGLKPALKKEYSKRKPENLSVQFASIDEFIGGEEDSDDLADIPDLPTLPVAKAESDPFPTSGLSGGPPVGGSSSNFPITFPAKKAIVPSASVPSGLPSAAGSEPPKSFPPKPISKSLPSFLPPKPKKAEESSAGEVASPPSNLQLEMTYAEAETKPAPGVPPMDKPSLGLKKLPPKVSTKPKPPIPPALNIQREPPDNAPAQVESNTLIVDGDVQIDNKYLFLGSPRLSAASDGRSTREIRRMSDSQEGLATLAGGGSSTLKAKGFFEAKAKELKESSIPSARRKKKKLSANLPLEGSSSSIPIGTIRGMYIRAASGWVKVNSKQGKAVAEDPNVEPTRSRDLHKSISLNEIRQKRAVGAKRAMFEQKAKEKKTQSQIISPKKQKKKSGFIKNGKGKW